MNDEQGKPVLVPLIRDGCEERNGSPWLDAEKLLPVTKDASEPGAADAFKRYDQLQTALSSVLGRKYTPKHHKRGPSDEEAAADQRELKRLRAECEDQASKIESQTAEIAKLTRARDHWRRLFNETKEELDALTEEPEEPSEEEEDEEDNNDNAHYSEVSEMGEEDTEEVLGG